MHRRFVASTILFVAAFSQDGWAESGNVFQFTWTHGSGAESCPAREKIARLVAIKLNRDPFDDASSHAIRGRIEWSEGEWIVHVDQFDGDRIVDTRDGATATPDCGSTLAMSAFLVTRLIETGPSDSKPPNAAPCIPAPTPCQPGPIPQPVTAPCIASPVPQVVPERRTVRPFDGALFLGGGIGIGLLPEPAGAISVNGAIGRGPIEVSTGMVFLPNVDVDEIFSFGLTAGWLGACLRTTPSKRLVFVGCANFLAGAAHSIVKDIDSFSTIHPGTRAWAAASMTPRLRLSLHHPLSIELGAHVIAPFTRHRYTVGNAELFTQPPITAIPFIQAGVSFF